MVKYQTVCRTQPAKKTVCIIKAKDACEDYLEFLEKNLPEMSSTSDLVKFKIYRSVQSAANNRKKGNCPPYFKQNSRSYAYPKKGVIEWLRQKMMHQQAYAA